MVKGELDPHGFVGTCGRLGGGLCSLLGYWLCKLMLY